MSWSALRFECDYWERFCKRVVLEYVAFYMWRSSFSKLQDYNIGQKNSLKAVITPT